MSVWVSKIGSEKIATIIKWGRKHILILSDFDKTLTKGVVDWKVWKSLISFLRDGEYLDPEYTQKAKDLFAKYHPIEINPDIDEQTKFEAMNYWWREHFEILIEYGLTRKILDRAIVENTVYFVNEIQNFLSILQEKNIPMVIISAGIEYLIRGILKKYNYFYDMLFIVANTFKFDGSDKILWVEEIIHGMNKYILESEKFPFYKQIQWRENCIVMGDSPSDIGMAEGWQYDVVLKIGFCHHQEQAKLFQEVFDVVIFDDEGLGWMNNFLNDVK